MWRRKSGAGRAESFRGRREEKDYRRGSRGAAEDAEKTRLRAEGEGRRIAGAHPSRETKARRMGPPSSTLVREVRSQNRHP